MMEELRTQLTALLERGWVKKSNAVVASPVVFATKRDPGGNVSLRMCIDYALNSRWR